MENNTVVQNQQLSLTYEPIDRIMQDQAREVAVLSSSYVTLSEINQKIQDYSKQTKSLLSVIPADCSDKLQDKNERMKIYQKLCDSIEVIDKNSQTIPKIITKFKSYISFTTNLIKQITQTLHSKIDNNLDIDEQEIKSRFQKQISQSNETFQQLSEMKNKIEDDLDQNDVINAKTKLLNSTKQIYQLQYTEQQIEDNEKQQEVIDATQKEINELKQQLSLESSKLKLLKLKKQEIQKNLDDAKNKLKVAQQQNDAQLEDIESKNKKGQEKNQELIDHLKQKLKDLLDKQANDSQNINDIQQKLIKESEKAYLQNQEQIQSLRIVSKKQAYIYILDESGSMEGEVFNQCTEAIKQMVSKQKLDNPNDLFCLIQFDNKARTTVNLEKFENIDVNLIGTEFRGGTTNFSKAFDEAYGPIECLHDSNTIIVFFTDGEDNSSQYQESLVKLKRAAGGNQSFMVCLGYGKDVNTEHLKNCLVTYNGNFFSKKLQNGEMIQTLYTINDPNEILNIFKKVTSSFCSQIDNLKEKNQLIQQDKQQYQQSLTQMALNISNVHDMTIKTLKQEIADLETKMINDPKQNLSIQEVYKKIQDQEIQKITELIKEINNENIKNEEGIQIHESKEESIEQEIEVKKNKLVQQQKSRLMIPDDDGNTQSSKEIIENQNLIRQKIKDFGFMNTQHFNELYQKLESAQKFQENIKTFNENIFYSAENVNSLLDSVISSIKSMSQSCENKQNDKNNYYKTKIKDYLNRNSQNQNQIQDYQNQNLILSFLKHSDADLEKLIEKDDDLKKCTEDIIQYLTNLEEISNLSNQIIKAKQIKGQAKIYTIEEYSEKIFDKLYKFEEQDDFKDEILIKLEAEIKQLEIEIEQAEEDDDDKKCKRLQNKLEKLEAKLEAQNEKAEERKEKQEEKEMKKHKKKYQKQYDLIVRIISNLSSSLQQLEYRLKQVQIFAPIKTLQSNFEDLSKSNQQIQLLKIEN
ncbi:hypothetical protein ABPG74_010281 [Tetrahymena malaccensis]